MRSRYRIHEPDRPHFITATIVEWLPVFTSSGCCDVVVRALCFARERKGLLNQLAYYQARYKSNSQHQAWQEGIHPQSIPTDEIMLQKLEYLHNNPVKRGLVALPEHWRYSSAHEWFAGALPVMRVDQCRQVV